MTSYNPQEFRLTPQVRERYVSHLIEANPVLTALYGSEAISKYIGNMTDKNLQVASQNSLGLFKIITPKHIIETLGLPQESSGNYRTAIQKHPILLKPYEGFALFDLNPSQIDRLAGGISLEEVLGDKMPTTMRIELTLSSQNSCDPPKRESGRGGRPSSRTFANLQRGRTDPHLRNSISFNGR